jgi:hypothetical protein
LKVWALNKRKPWSHLLFEVARRFFPPTLVGVPKHKRPAFWLNTSFVKRNRLALQGYENRLKLFGPLPSFQDNLGTLEMLRRQLVCSVLSSEPPYEKRYPYLDRSLLEFVYAVPQEQLVRPGQRRSLMRRSLLGIVPDELLNRKRKAFVARAPLASISGDWTRLVRITQYLVSSSLSIVERNVFLEELQKARLGQTVAIVLLMRTLTVERWLTTLADRRLLGGRGDEARRRSRHSFDEVIPSSTNKPFSQLRSTLK